jgi:hypothetical protein
MILVKASSLLERVMTIGSENLADHCKLGNLCKGLVVNPYHSPWKSLRALQTRALRETRVMGKVLLSVKTHRRTATGNTRSREAPETAGGPRSLDQRPEIRHTTWRLGC